MASGVLVPSFERYFDRLCLILSNNYKVKGNPEQVIADAVHVDVLGKNAYGSHLSSLFGAGTRAGYMERYYPTRYRYVGRTTRDYSLPRT